MVGGGLDATGGTAGGTVQVEDQWVEREYIYTPGYVHEFIAQIDRYGDPLFILQDATRNVIGLVDETGAIARQYTYDPYGDLIFSEMLANHAHNRIGHKGLFFDRLNAPTTARQLVPAAQGFYHNTNRAYAPEYGRYLQADPYGTGMPVLESMALHGVMIDLSTSTPSFNELLADGMNRFAYLGSEPVMRRDPAGLYSVLSLGFGSSTAAELGATKAAQDFRGSAAVFTALAALGVLSTQEGLVFNSGLTQQFDGTIQDVWDTVLGAIAAEGAARVAGHPKDVLQTGGNTVSKRTADALNEHAGTDYARRDWGRAIERLKRFERRRNDDHGHQILRDGTVRDRQTKREVGNLRDHLP